MMMGESEWMLNFNFRPNHKCVRRDNISKMGCGVNTDSVHRFLRSQMKNRELNQTRPDTFFVWFGLEFRFRRFCPSHLHP